MPKQLLLLILLAALCAGCGMIGANKDRVKIVAQADLTDLIRSMADNPSDAGLNKALVDADSARGQNDSDFISLLAVVYRNEHPGASLGTLFSKIHQANDAVGSLAPLYTKVGEATQVACGILGNRLGNYAGMHTKISGNTNGRITLLLAGKINLERIREIITPQGQMQFFETYANEEIGSMLVATNDALRQYLTTPVKKEQKHKANTSIDTNSLAAYVNGDHVSDTAHKTNPLFDIMAPSLSSDQSSFQNGPVVGYVRQSDTTKLHTLLALEVVKARFPPNIRFVYGAVDAKKHESRPVLLVYAIKIPPDGVAMLDGRSVSTVRADYDPLTGNPDINIEMTKAGALKWEHMTTRNIGRYIALTFDGVVFSCPRVDGAIRGGATQISGSFTTDQALDLANVLKSKGLPFKLHISREEVINEK